MFCIVLNMEMEYDIVFEHTAVVIQISIKSLYIITNTSYMYYYIQYLYTQNLIHGRSFLNVFPENLTD